MQVEYNLEWLPDLWDELEPLMFAHYHEIDQYSKDRPLEINKQAYDQMAEAGRLERSWRVISRTVNRLAT